MSGLTRASSRALRALWRRQLNSYSTAATGPGVNGVAGGAHSSIINILDSFRTRLATCVPPPPWRVLEHTQLLAPDDALERTPVFVGYSQEGIDAAVRRCFPYPRQSPPWLRQQQPEPCFLGFDLEYTPTFVRGVPIRRTALVQVSSEEHTVLAHLYHLLAFPQALAQLLRHPGCVLVCVGVSNDVEKLAADYGVRCANFLDIGVVAELYGYTRTGLKSLSAAFGVAVNKSARVQCGNWERIPLKPPQVSYAALDAQLSLWLLHQLHGAHARHVPLHVWAANFVNVVTLRQLVASKQATRPDSPLLHAIMRHRQGVHVLQQHKERVKAAQRMKAALSRGLSDAEQAVAALAEIALAQKAEITWDDDTATRAPQEKVVAPYTASVALNSSVLATGAGKTRKLARRVAAVNALRALAMTGGDGAATDASATFAIA